MNEQSLSSPRDGEQRDSRRDSDFTDSINRLIAQYARMDLVFSFKLQVNLRVPISVSGDSVVTRANLICLCKHTCCLSRLPKILYTEGEKTPTPER